MKKLEKWKEFLKEMCPSKINIIVLCISLLVGAFLTDIGWENTFTFAVINAFFTYEVIYCLVWTIYAIVIAVLIKRKEKKELKKECNQTNENK